MPCAFAEAVTALLAVLWEASAVCLISSISAAVAVPAFKAASAESTAFASAFISLTIEIGEAPLISGRLKAGVGIINSPYIRERR
nr:MAG TPA: hypothetical protein [Caudoviricetes sp.]